MPDGLEVLFTIAMAGWNAHHAYFDGTLAAVKSCLDPASQARLLKHEGLTTNMPVVGRWQSKNGTVFYLAVGTIVDGKGQPVKT